MNDIRKHWLHRPDEFLQLIADTEAATGMPITAELYKKPKPCDNPDLAPYFAWRGNISCVVEEEFSPDTFGPELGLRVKDFLTKLIPLYDYFNQFKI